MHWKEDKTRCTRIGTAKEPAPSWQKGDGAKVNLWINNWLRTKIRGEGVEYILITLFSSSFDFYMLKSCKAVWGFYFIGSRWPICWEIIHMVTSYVLPAAIWYLLLLIKTQHLLRILCTKNQCLQHWQFLKNWLECLVWT